MRVFISAGEPSGDAHGARLIGQLSKQTSPLEAVGFGGRAMAAAGCRLLADMTDLAVMWAARAAANLPQFARLLNQARREMDRRRPDAVVLIDYPGFNWWVARAAKARGVPVIYYGAPQLWAWASWRVRKMRRLTDLVLCQLPFETAWYRKRRCRAEYVGHPFFEDADPTPGQRPPTISAGSGGPLVVLLPGSRMQEVTANLPVFLRTAARVRRWVPQARFAVAAYNEVHADAARRMAADAFPDVEIAAGRTDALIAQAHCCLACSGSVSLQLLHHCKPAVIHYRISRWAHALQDRFRTTRYITLVNLLAAGDRFHERRRDYDPDAPDDPEAPLPEYLTWQDCSAPMARRLTRWLTEPAARAACVRRLESLKRRYGQPGASRRAAARILRLLETRRASAPRAA